MFAGLRRWARDRVGLRSRPGETSTDRILAQLGPTEEFDVTIEHDGRTWVVAVPDLELVARVERRDDAELAARTAIASELGLRLDEVSVHVLDGD
ncbi:hypothetical protein MMAD_02200 [Mycolicibacterium madagascariense]|uniref:Uncharacterized protein n=1 Tax=Mycolicibacterium madagascariense TaxID=212765 RepID=A0A7I7X9G3_9MYCO|nr:hypothetical protein [Mycolicibacterium madagascariense]MCV7013357.1 hypothetical protein [Mycolicibacterium madagascariense]BBZ25925.1 hypothetical protein MMAD_02200 [Mycolicibacterium madagascariense]